MSFSSRPSRLIGILLSVLSAVVCQSDTQFVVHLQPDDVCQQIAGRISPFSSVDFPGSPAYSVAIAARYFSSYSYNSTCSVEPGNLEDLEIILQALASTRTPFAVKGGGHSFNPGFSSTTGIQISMTRFSEVSYNPDTEMATIGAGQLWDNVNDALAPYGVSVLGARVPGVGVAGFTLGGGYAWKTNQFGLALDSVQGYELVLPNGQAVNVTEESDPELFIGLKGGLQNFGIVTKFTLKTYPQTDVWGGFLLVHGSQSSAVTSATAMFAAHVVDPKASVLTTYSSQPGFLQFVQLFYDSPDQPAELFDDFLAIPSIAQNVSVQSYTSFIQTFSYPPPVRGLADTVSVSSLPVSFHQAVINETMFWGPILEKRSGHVQYAIEPFLSNIFSHNTTASAYPPDRSRTIMPIFIGVVWHDPAEDDFMYDVLRQSSASLQSQAVAMGISDVTRYPNYAVYDTPLEALYGDNLENLKELKRRVDPDNIMGLAGGFKF